MKNQKDEIELNSLGRYLKMRSQWNIAEKSENFKTLEKRRKMTQKKLQEARQNAIMELMALRQKYIDEAEQKDMKQK